MLFYLPVVTHGHLCYLHVRTEVNATVAPPVKDVEDKFTEPVEQEHAHNGWTVGP
jgi:hypothetical protein